MAASQIIVAGNTAASVEFTLAAGEKTTLALNGLGSDGLVPVVVVDVRDGADGYAPIGDLIGGPRDVSGPATFRVRRLRGTCGVFRA